jgi:hypothetical protein
MKYLFVLLSFISMDVPAQETMRTQLDQFRKDFVQCQFDQKFERLHSYYADDLRFMPEFQKTVMGKKKCKSVSSSFRQTF